MKPVSTLPLFISLLAFGLGCGLQEKLLAPKVERYPEMNSKISEFFAVNYTQEAEKVELKGKIAVVIRPDSTTPANLDRFDTEGVFNDKSGLLPAELYAKTPDEVESLIIISCEKSTESGLFQDTAHNTRTITFEKLQCPTDIYDHKAKKLIAKATFYGGGKSSAVSVRPGQDLVKAEFPQDGFKKFLDTIPNPANQPVMAHPAGTTIELASLIDQSGNAKKGVAQNYNGQQITTTGFILYSRDRNYDFELIYVDEDHAKGNIACRPSPAKGVATAFGSMRHGDNKVTITGTLKVKDFGSPDIENCQLVSFEAVPD